MSEEKIVSTFDINILFYKSFAFLFFKELSIIEPITVFEAFYSSKNNIEVNL